MKKEELSMGTLLVSFSVGVGISALIGHALAPADKKLTGAVLGAMVGGVLVGPGIVAGVEHLALPAKGSR